MAYYTSLEKLALPSRDDVIAAVHAIVPQRAATPAGAR
jgi:hypothetical protein